MNSYNENRNSLNEYRFTSVDVPQYVIMRATKYIIHKKSMIILMALLCRQRSGGWWTSIDNC